MEIILSKHLKNRYFILRHGESKANVARIVVSGLEDGKREEYALTETGENQVRLSVKKARSEKLLGSDTIIYSSPFSRAKRTAEIAKEVLQVDEDIVFDDRLRERWFGDWEKTDNSAYQKVWNDDKINPEHKIKNVESAAEVKKRVMSLVEDLENEYENRSILLVSHGDALQILQTGFENISPSCHRQLPHLGTAEIRELKRASSFACQVKSVNDMSNTPPDNSVLVNVCIIPDSTVSEKCIELSQLLRSRDTMFVLDGKNKFAHMTLFMARFASSELPRVVDAVKNVVERREGFLCEQTGYFMTTGRYLEVSYRRSEPVLDLHEALLNKLKEYRINPGNPFIEGYFTPYTSEQRRNAEETGYDLAHDLYRPHITLTRYKENTLPETFPIFAAARLSFRISKVCLYKADNNGAVFERLAEFTVQ